MTQILVYDLRTTNAAGHKIACGSPALPDPHKGPFIFNLYINEPMIAKIVVWGICGKTITLC